MQNIIIDLFFFTNILRIRILFIILFFRIK